MEALTELGIGWGGGAGQQSGRTGGGARRRSRGNPEEGALGLLVSTCGLTESLRRDHGDQQDLSCTGDEGKRRRRVLLQRGGRGATAATGWGCELE